MIKNLGRIIMAIWMLGAALPLLGAARVVYVSSSTGSDTGDGSAERPVEHFWRAMQLNPSEIRLKCGDVFYGSLSLDHCDLSSYGEGDMPTLCGLKILKGKPWVRGTVEGGRWRKSSKGDVWRASLCGAKDEYDGYSPGGSLEANNVGQIVDCNTSAPFESMRVPSVSELTSDFDFTLGRADGSLTDRIPEDFDYLFVKTSTDLNKVRVGVAVFSNGLNMTNSVVTGIRVEYWGRHGISCGSNTTVRGCEVDHIGGSWFAGYVHEWVTLGNGIEYFIGSGTVENGLVENCTVRHCLDCGLTVQGGSDTDPVRARNIVFRNNAVENCSQSFEFFLRGTTDDSRFFDCECTGNVSVDAGIGTGFRDFRKRYKRCHFLDNSFKRRTYMRFVGNTLVNGNYYCAGKCGDRYDASLWEDNVCYIRRGQDLIGNYNGNADVVTVPLDKGSYSSLQEATEAAIARYRQLTGDTTTRFNIVEPTAE